MKKLTVYLAVSLDGYLADPQGGVDWLAGEDPGHPGAGSYPQFLQTVDTVLMGRATYDQITTQLSPGVWPYEGLDTWVLTHRPAADLPGLHFTGGELGALVESLRSRPGKGIWACGGADLVGQLAATGLVDRWWLTLVPILLGDGVRLFDRAFPPVPLHLCQVSHENGMVDLIYERR